MQIRDIAHFEYGL